MMAVLLTVFQGWQYHTVGLKGLHSSMLPGTHSLHPHHKQQCCLPRLAK